MKIVDDGMHYNRQKCLSINSAIYFWLSGRAPGKSTQALELALSSYFKTGAITLWILRDEATFKDAKYWRSFLNHFEDFDATVTQEGVFETLKNAETGDQMLDKAGYVQADMKKPIIYFAAISTMAKKLKSIVLEGVKWIIFEEFIPNLKLPRQKYQPNEAETFMSCMSTIARNNNYETKTIFIGNPYQMNNPYFRFLHIDPIEVTKHKDVFYMPFHDDPIVYEDKKYEQVVIHYFSVDPRLLAKIKGTPYGKLLAHNKDFFDTEMSGASFFERIAPVANVPLNKCMLLAKVSIEKKIVYLYAVKDYNEAIKYIPEDKHEYLKTFPIIYVTEENSGKKKEMIALNFDEYSDNAVLIDNEHPQYCLMKKIGYSLRRNLYVVNKAELDYFANEIVANL